MTDEPTPKPTFKEFLESVHPSVEKEVSDLWHYKKVPPGRQEVHLRTPELRLHCPVCKGERTFRYTFGGTSAARFDASNYTYMAYLCGDCHRSVKRYAIEATLNDEAKGDGQVFKYGEKPSFGAPVPNRLLRLFGDDGEMFLKGRRCENQGLGIAAFAYYRRVVENHKDSILDEVIRTCEAIQADTTLIDALRSAKSETSFSKAIETIRPGLPKGLLIDGHNPLLALHGALSVGLHNESDQACLTAAHDVRLVLTALAERMAALKSGSAELSSAVQRLISKNKNDGD